MSIDLTKKKILVTGAHGFVGQHLVKNLIEKRQVPKKNLFLPASPGQGGPASPGQGGPASPGQGGPASPGQGGPKAKELDLRKWENCREAVRAQDIIIHLAAVTGGIELHRLNPGRIFYDNIIMGVQLMEAARQEKAEKFVVVGSATEYPENLESPLKEDKLWEGYPQEIHAPYALAKKILLVQGQAYRKQYGFNAIHLLMTNVYGPGMDFGDDSYVIPSLMKKIENSKKKGWKFINVWSNGKPKRDFLYVEDAVEGILLATEKYNKPDSVNLGFGHDISIRELVDILCKIMDFKGKVRWDTSKPSGQMRRLLDIAFAKKEFGFKPKIALKQGLLKTIQSYGGN